MEKEYIVVTVKGVDVAEIDSQLQRDTSGDGAVPNTIPGRTVDVVNARAYNNRMTHYNLTDEEAQTLSTDARILSVCEKPLEETQELYATQSGNFQRTTSDTQTSVNWGLWRHIQKALGEPDTSSTTFTQDYTYTLDGTGVDLVIQDDGVDPTGHPEWEDYAGNTRFNQVDWYQLTGMSGTMPANFYSTSTGDSNRAGAHGSHCCGIAAGKTYGWAKNAQIYSMRIFGGTGYRIDTDRYDLIRLFHEQKPVDPNTGYKRPTVCNQSWGYSWYYRNSQFGSEPMTAVYFRGVDQSRASAQWTSADSQYGMVASRHPMEYLPADVEQEQLTDAGVICVKAAGNGYHPCAGQETGQYGSTRYNSYYTMGTTWAGYISSGNPIYYNRPSSPHSMDTVWVGNIDYTKFGTEEMLAESSERGERLDINAAGSEITSATSTTSVYSGRQLHPDSSSHYIARISGTSMAAPQVAGVACLYMQVNPGATAADFKDFLNKTAKEYLYDTGGADDYVYANSTPRLYGGTKKVLYFPLNSPNKLKYGNNSGFDKG